MRAKVTTNYGGGYVYKGHLYQTDWEYPGLAQDLGWALTRVQIKHGRTVHMARRSRVGCEHNGTDGTVTCPDCGLTAGDFIRAAASYLDSLA
jgi:hypothetical protein